VFKALQGIRGLARERPLDDSKLWAGKLDSCYAYSSERAVIEDPAGKGPADPGSLAKLAKPGTDKLSALTAPALADTTAAGQRHADRDQQERQGSGRQPRD